jgi:hypothetical protein
VKNSRVAGGYLLDQEIIFFSENRRFVSFLTRSLNSNISRPFSCLKVSHLFFCFTFFTLSSYWHFSYQLCQTPICTMLKHRRPSFKQYSPWDLHLLSIHFNTTLPSISCLLNSEFQLQSCRHFLSYTCVPRLTQRFTDLIILINNNNNLITYLFFSLLYIGLFLESVDFAQICNQKVWRNVEILAVFHD